MPCYYSFAFHAAKRKQQIVMQNEAEILPEDIVEMRYDQIKMAGIDTGSIELRSLSGT